jgi:hypothetical protein
MTEISFFWGGVTHGDHGSYHSNTFAENMARLLNNDITLDSVLTGKANELIVTDRGIASSEVLVDTGSALVNGRLYINTASKPVAVLNNYIVVLKIDYAGKTITATAHALPLVQTPGVTWEVLLASVTVAAGVATVTDLRTFCKFSNRPKAEDIKPAGSEGQIPISSGAIAAFKSFVEKRQGGSSTDWRSTGVTTYTPSGMKIQCGYFVTNEGGSGDMYTHAYAAFSEHFSGDPLCFITGDYDILSDDYNSFLMVRHDLTPGNELEVWGWESTPAGSGIRIARLVSWLAIGPS